MGPRGISYDGRMFTSQSIGFVRSPYQTTSEIPKGYGAKHDAEGVLDILPQFEAGLTDLEGFSHLFVIWEFDRSQGFELFGKPPIDSMNSRILVSLACWWSMVSTASR